MNVESGQSLYGIHQSFAETELGEILSQRVRYDTYLPDHVSNERWEELLGADVNNLNHLPLTYGLAKSMIRHFRQSQPGFLSPHEEEILKATALIHDWAEAIIGDIDYNDKTEEDEAEELRHLTAILDERYTEDTTGVKQILLEALDVVHDPTSKLGRVFNTLERVGYVRTALRAASHVRAGTAPDCANELGWLASNVLDNHTAILIERAEEYAPVKTYLMNQAEVITASFACIDPIVFDFYPDEVKTARQESFNSTHLLWLETKPTLSYV
jgi:hypothetical protein